MKRCPKCNRTYPTDTQRFCTHDGGLLVVTEARPSGPISVDTDETDAPTKMISQELAADLAKFDPFKTTMGTPVEAEQTSEIRGGATAGLPPPPAATGQGSAELGSQTLPGSPAPPPPPAPPVSGNLPPSGSGPIAAPPVSGNLPPSGSGPIAAPPASGNLPPSGSEPIPSPPAPTLALGQLPSPQFIQQAAPPQQVQQVPPAAAKKKSKVPLILGVLAVLFVVGAAGIVVAYIFAIKPMLAKRGIQIQSPVPSPTEAPPIASPSTVTTASPTAPVENGPSPYAPPADAVQFVNSSKNLDGKLADHYVDFAFYYPERWQKDPKTGVPGANNFIEVHRSLPGDFTQESMAVSWYDSAGSFQDDQELFPSYVEKKSAQFEKSISQYRKVSEGPTKIGNYDAYEFRFEGMSQDPKKGELKIWGRVVWLPAQEKGKSGITLLMFGTSLASELKSVDDVGVKGELSMLLESFRFGPASQ